MNFFPCWSVYCWGHLTINMWRGVYELVQTITSCRQQYPLFKRVTRRLLHSYAFAPIKLYIYIYFSIIVQCLFEIWCVCIYTRWYIILTKDGTLIFLYVVLCAEINNDYTNQRCIGTTVVLDKITFLWITCFNGSSKWSSMPRPGWVIKSHIFRLKFQFPP